MYGTSHLASSEFERPSTSVQFLPQTVICARLCFMLVVRPLALMVRKQPPAYEQVRVSCDGLVISSLFLTPEPYAVGAVTLNLCLTPSAVHRLNRDALQSGVSLKDGTTLDRVTGKPVSKTASALESEITEHESAIMPRASTSQTSPVPYRSRFVPSKVNVV